MTVWEGAGVMTPSESLSWTFGKGNYSSCQGWNVELSGVVTPVAGAVGYNFSGGWYWQGGGGVGTGAGLTGYYVF